MSRAAPAWRKFIHGEHDGPHGMHYVTDAREKYIRHHKTGEEYLFDLEEDPQELCNLAPRREHAARLNLWRERMIAHLEPRGEELGGKLKEKR